LSLRFDRLPTSSPPRPSLSHLSRVLTPFIHAQPFLLLAKSARGAGAANLITQATSAAGVYVFSELLEQQSIKDVRFRRSLTIVE
jgi:hypothetical protein